MLLQELDNKTDDKVVMRDCNENVFASDVSILKLMEQYGHHLFVDLLHPQKMLHLLTMCVKKFNRCHFIIATMRLFQ